MFGFWDVRLRLVPQPLRLCRSATPLRRTNPISTRAHAPSMHTRHVCLLAFFIKQCALHGVAIEGRACSDLIRPQRLRRRCVLPTCARCSGLAGATRCGLRSAHLSHSSSAWITLRSCSLGHTVWTSTSAHSRWKKTSVPLPYERCFAMLGADSRDAAGVALQQVE